MLYIVDMRPRSANKIAMFSFILGKFIKRIGQFDFCFFFYDFRLEIRAEEKRLKPEDIQFTGFKVQSEFWDQ